MSAIDFHVHVGASLYGGGLGVAELLRRMERLEIERAVVIAPKPPGYCLEPENRRLRELAEARPDRFVAFCRVDPWQRERAVAEAASCLAGAGAMAGLFLHPWEEGFAANDPVVDPVVEVARRARKPVMIAGGHARVSLAPQVADLVGRFPDVTFVVTSGGQINISGVALGEARRLFLEHPNTVLETSGIYRLDFIEDMAGEIGASRIVFGSDAPRFDQELELRRVQWAHRSDEDREAFARGTARRLLGVDSSQ
ncbi:MAG: amidohydrolase family protein [Candidatus Wallbacteria bacterium]|nr:amidohydrolase family protein [Candidatus Wallbacteria bacterium]